MMANLSFPLVYLAELFLYCIYLGKNLFFLQEKSPFPKWNRAFVDDAGIEPATR